MHDMNIKLYKTINFLIWAPSHLWKMLLISANAVKKYSGFKNNE
jgi:hypothetical protein